MRPMFPHIIDRYRVLSYMLKEARNSFRHESGKIGIKQDELAEKAEVSQGTISTLENLGTVAESNGTISREMIIQVAMKGLKQTQRSIDAGLWLLDGEDFRALDEDELFRGRGYLGKALPEDYEGSSALRLKVVGSLERLVRQERHKTQEKKKKRKKDSKPPEEVDVWMIFGSDPGHNLQENRELSEIEKRKGQRMFVSKYPSYLTYPDSIPNEWERWSDGESMSAPQRSDYKKLTTERREEFLTSLKDFGDRSVHSIESLRAYSSKKLTHYFDWDERNLHLENLLRLLESEEYPLFEVGLVETPPELEYFIKSTVVVSITGARAYAHSGKEEITCGPRFIFFRDPISVLSFLVDFERLWDRIPPGDRDRESVARKVRAALRKGKRHANRASPKVLAANALDQ